MSAAPELDLLVVGGGPAGTATAFRGRELGLEVLVIDYDDLMKRIRDYAKDKLILPGFGGGDRMSFPRGGELMDALRFAPIDKDDICQSWKQLYREHQVAARVGVELVGLEKGSGGGYEAKVWDHTRRCEETIATRAVAIAIGRGVPRRFDIPGDTDGIANRLRDAADFVGAPACVIGGGTSAAEAVIAISSAKTEAGDPTAVYWSYRGDKMPRVSKALAEVFFEAYVGNGNIRYYPRSEPTAVVTAEDRREYLAVRVDRRRMDGRPAETAHLEFPKASCLACIGEEIPEELLAELGIPRVVGGPRAKPRIAVTPWLESARPGLFVAGDLLCPAYLTADELDGDPSTFAEVKHRGNIKTAMRDGVTVAEAVRQRLDGRATIDVRLEDAEELAAPGPPDGTSGPAPDGGPGERSEARLVRLLPGGVEAEEFALDPDGMTTLGSGDCDLSFPDDSTLSAAHASIVSTDQGYLLRDDGGSGGVFLRLRPAAKTPLADGDLLRAGRQFLLVARDGDDSVLAHFDAAGREVGRHPLSRSATLLGRGDDGIRLAEDDATLSRRHLAVAIEDGGVMARDLKSVNGTYLRVRGAAPLADGDRFRLGQQQLAFVLGADSVVDADPAPGAAEASPPTAAPTGASAASVTFAGRDGALPLAPGQTVCAAAEAAGVEITAECHSGICGSDPVRILSGAEHVDSAAGDQERETLTELCDLEPGECRLACMLRAKGPLEVEIV